MPSSGNEFEKDDYFKVDVEMHIVGDMSSISYFPGVKAWWDGVAGVARTFMMTGKPGHAPSADEIAPITGEDAIIELMDRYGVDVSCVIPESMMDTTGYATRWVTNGEAAAVCERYPDRLILTPNVGPVKIRGIKNVLWEFEYLVKERDARIVKIYPPEDLPLDDPQMYPVYEKAAEMGIPLSIHTGWCWVPPGESQNCLPVLLDKVATDFPEVTFIAFHAGYPHYLDLALSAAVHPNIYIGLNLLYPWALTAPRRFAEILGEALRFVGPERVVWGTDCAGFPLQVRGAVQGLREFQIPEDMQEGYGYPPLSEQDKARIFGLNMARLLKIDSKRRI